MRNVIQFIQRWFKSSSRLVPTRLDASQFGIRVEDFDPAACKIIRVLTKAGFEAYIVGGAIRDLLCGVQPKDFDCVTDARPEQIKALFHRSQIIGRRFRLVHVRMKDQVIEVSTFRAHLKKKTRRAQTEDAPYGNLSTDAVRRDFTFNALYYDLITNEIIDPVGAIADIQAKRCQVIGQPLVRFEEDPVRMVRAIRLCAKLGFNMDQTTQSAIRAKRVRLLDGSKERLFLEVMKLFYTGHGRTALTMLQQQRMFFTLFPTLEPVLRDADPSAWVMLEQRLYNTDKRFHRDESLSASFLFATIYWPLFSSVRVQQHNDREGQRQAIAQIFDGSNLSMALAKKNIESIEAIWLLQGQMESMAHNRILSILGHGRFRAAYDFLVLRARFDPQLSGRAIWWDRVQHAAPGDRQKMIASLARRRTKQSRSKPSKSRS